LLGLKERGNEACEVVSWSQQKKYDKGGLYWPVEVGNNKWDIKR